MIIEIDYREKKLIENMYTFKEICTFDFIIKEKNLNLGDICIKDNQDNLLLLYERKTIADLASSIQDGRYKEQSYRLSHSHIHNHNIVYLIEGNIEHYNDKYSRIKKSALYSALFTLQYYKGFTVVQTKDCLDSVNYLIRVLNKLNREKLKLGYYEGNKEFENQSYSSCIKSEKKTNITRDNIGIIMLSSVPGVSNQTATVLLEDSESLYKFLERCKENSNYLENKKIKIGEKERKISKRVIENIKNMLF